MPDELTPAQKAARTKKRRATGKKAARRKKLRAAGRKAAKTKKRRAAARKAWETAAPNKGSGFPFKAPYGNPEPSAVSVRLPLSREAEHPQERRA